MHADSRICRVVRSACITVQPRPLRKTQTPLPQPDQTQDRWNASGAESTFLVTAVGPYARIPLAAGQCVRHARLTGAGPRREVSAGKAPWSSRALGAGRVIDLADGHGDEPRSPRASNMPCTLVLSQKVILRPAPSAPRLDALAEGPEGRGAGAPVRFAVDEPWYRNPSGGQAPRACGSLWPPHR